MSFCVVNLGLSIENTRSLRMEEFEELLERYQDEQKLIDRRYALLTYTVSQVGGMKKKGGSQFKVDDFLLLQHESSKMSVDEMERRMKMITMQMGGKVVGKG